VGRQPARSRKAQRRAIPDARSFNLYLTYNNAICLLILACHCAIVGNHLVASFQTAPLPTVAT